MALVALQNSNLTPRASTTPAPPQTRKRTSSFFQSSSPSSAASPRPTKVPRTSTPDMSSLRRTQSLLVLPAFEAQSSSSPSAAPSVPYTRSLRHYKEQRERQKALNRLSSGHITIRTRREAAPSASSSQAAPLTPVPFPSSCAAAAAAAVARRSSAHGPTPQAKTQPQQIQPHIPSRAHPPTPSSAPSSAATTSSVNSPSTSISTNTSTSTQNTRTTSSPLSPNPTHKPHRPSFPRSKPEPDLYRKALITRMMGTPEGQKIMHMGARLAVSIMTATRELEKIVAAQTFEAGYGAGSASEDVVMMDVCQPSPFAGSSQWSAKEDWEMVDCAA
ncbi:hypothetical protein AX16_010202 [Volvariella volvacea WC 439]|nr:hypothetical protein AX16_010202 [Volvariella volvacea WC 439]